MFPRNLFFRPWSRLTVAAVVLLALAGGFLTAVLWLDGQPAVQAQSDQGAVSNLSVSSPNARQLLVAWSAPSAAPSDYRVRWAPSGQDYLAFSEPNTSERGSAYPTGTGHTVRNLSAGASYKVQVRARYNTGEHADNPWSGPWSGQATVIISSPPPPPPPPTPETTPEPTQEPTPEPTPATDAVTGLALSSDTAGQLAIAWTEPSEQPNDYRISWAPASEDYLSYSAENTSRRGNSYPAGSATSLTLTGLPGGVNYKVIMRARYHNDQTNEDHSGPWTNEATQQVRNNPPAAPAGLRTLATSNQVTLQWEDDPDDDTITGYEIWRGPKASSLQVLAADTGSADNSYLDDAVTPETTYHYAINAINADGTGQQSDTISATTQAPPKLQQRDDQTISVRQSTAATAAVSNIGSATATVLPISTDGQAVATSFTTGSDPGGYTLTGARLKLNAEPGAVFTVTIHEDGSDAPGTGLRTLTHPASVDGDAATTEEFTATPTVPLAASTKYWLVITRVSGIGTLRTATANSTTPDSGGLAGWSIGATRNRPNATGSWANLPINMAIGVLGNVTVPRLTNVAITSRPLDGDTYKAGENIELEFTFNTPVEYKGGVVALRVGDQTDNSNYRSAHNVGGSGTVKLLYRYKVKSTDTDTTGVGADGNPLGTGATDKIVDANGNAVTLTLSALGQDTDHKVAGGTVGCEYLLCADVGVAELSSTVLGFFYYTSGNAGSLSNREFTLGQSFLVEQVVLRNSNQLEIVLDRPPTPRLLSQGTLHIGTIFHHFHEGTVDGNRVTWPVTGLTWTDGDERRITIQDDIFVSNLGKAAVSTGLQTDATIEAFAQKFTTGSYANGYLINVVDLQAQVAGDSVVRVSIYDDFFDTPAVSMYELTNPSSFSAGSSASARFTATDVHLRANEPYWLVWERVSGTGITAVSYATDSGEDRGVALGWSIADSVHKYNGSTWSEHTISGSSDIIMRLSIRGEESRNIAATGTVSITGVLEQGLPAGALYDIYDPQGAIDPELQWSRVDGGVDSIISGANGETYTIQAADVGKRLKVRASFNDLAGNAESVTSEVSAVVSAASTYLVSNLGQSTNVSTESLFNIQDDAAAAQDFTIGGGTGTYRLDAVRLFATGFGLGPRVSIYSDSSGSPGSSLHVLTNPSIIDFHQNTLEEFSGSNIVLNGTDKYWLVVELREPGTGSFSPVTLDGDGDEDTGGEAGSSIGDAVYSRDSGTWAQATGGPFVLMMGLRGEVASNRAPTFTNSTESLSVNENAAANTVVGTVSATDLDNDTLTYSVSGADLAAFNEDFTLNTGTGQITVKSGATIDFESKSSYTVTLTATDDEGDTDTVTVTINVTNIEEPGSVSLSASQPQLGVALTATLTDPDGGINGQIWQWARGDTASGTFANISGATSSSYSPVQDDVGKYLRLSVTYTDTLGSGKSATKTTDNAVVATVTNQAPAFSTAARTLTVAENPGSGTVLGTISATDLDNDTLTYSVSGADLTAFNEDFTLNTGTGQITVKSGATIDFESRPSYTVTLTATDPDSDTGTVTVTINVTNVEEPGSVSLSASQPQLGVSLTATLTDPDGGITGQIWQWASGDTASGTFANISGATSASYTPVQADVGKYLKVSVTYTDTLASSRSATKTADNAVVATVTNQAPTFSTNARTLTVAENAAANAVVSTVSATDPNGDTLTYSVSGTDLAAFNEDFTLNTGSGQVRVKSGATIDFESRPSYAVTIGVTDSKDPFGNASSSIDDTISVTISVTNREEAGTVALSTLRPVLNLPLSAALTDPDGGISGQSWQWSRGNTATGSFSNIGGATSSTYTPLQADVDRYLKARVSYTDALSSGRSAEAVSANPVIDVPIDNVAPAFPSTGYTRSVAENAPVEQDLGAPITARDANRDSLTYSLGGPGARAFRIVADTGQLRTGRTLDFEGKSEYVLTITARDPDGLTGTTTLTVNVTNVEEAGAVTISPGRPQLDNRARATVTDPDGGVRGVRWQWSRGDTETGPFSTISGATSAEYRTTDSDNGKFLRARARYTDTLGSGRSAEQVTSGPVMPDRFEGVVQFYPWNDAGDLPVGGSATGHIQGGEDADGEDVRDEIDYFELTGLTGGETHQITLVSSDAESYHFTGVTYYGPASHLNHQTMGDFQRTTFSPGRRHILFTPSGPTRRYFIGVKGHSSADHEYTLRLFKPAADDYSAGTTGAAADGSFGSGKIERLYDIDWHRTTNLSGSVRYLAALSGAGSDPLHDPVIHGVYDPSGNLIPDTSDTSSGPGKSSALVFTPESPGRYYIAVRSNARPWVASGAPDPTGRGHTGSYSLTVGIINEPDNHHGTTTMRLGTANTPLVLNQEYSQEFALEHREDQEYIKVSVQENKVYEVYVHGVRDGFPSMSVFTQQDANQPFYPSIPEAACWTTWHRVFATPEDFGATYRDYVVKLTAGPSGAGTGTVTIKLIDNDAGNYRSHRDRCP